MIQILFFLALLNPSLASINEEIAISMVPRGKIYEQSGRDFTIKTPAGTKVQIEFNRDGKFKEASGKNLNKGDDLEPGEGLLSLSTVAQKVQKVEGPWALENDKELGWIYELNHEHIVDAKSGKVISSKSLAKLQADNL